MDNIAFRKATPSDAAAITAILRMAATRMLAEGKHQWDENYPGREHVGTDIAGGAGYVLESGNEIMGYGAVVFSGEPAYGIIEGKWLTDSPYVVVHRMAIRQPMERMGLGSRFIHAVEQLARSEGIHSFRIDTNHDSSRMLSLLKRTGFTFCGTVRYEKGSRLAFEKVL